MNSFAPLAKADEIDIFLLLDRDVDWQGIVIDGFGFKQSIYDHILISNSFTQYEMLILNTVKFSVLDL